MWFNEGMAEYFGSGGSFASRAAAAGGTRPRFQESARALVRFGLWRPFKEFMNLEREEFYGRMTAHYAQAWSMIRFFVEDRRYLKILQAYYKAVRDGSTGQEAFEATFGKIDASRMVEDWKTSVTGIK